FLASFGQRAPRLRADPFARADDGRLRRLEGDVLLDDGAGQTLELLLDLLAALSGFGDGLLFAAFEWLQALRLLRLEALQLRVEIAGEFFDLLGVGALLAADLGFQILLDGADQARALRLVYIDDDVLGEV